jgi:hypothetical protein
MKTITVKAANIKVGDKLHIAPYRYNLVSGVRHIVAGMVHIDINDDTGTLIRDIDNDVQVLVRVTDLGEVTWRADGSANEYHLLRNDDWLAAIKFNGEFNVHAQTEMLNLMLDALN